MGEGEDEEERGLPYQGAMPRIVLLPQTPLIYMLTERMEPLRTQTPWAESTADPGTADPNSPTGEAGLLCGGESQLLEPVWSPSGNRNHTAAHWHLLLLVPPSPHAKTSGIGYFPAFSEALPGAQSEKTVLGPTLVASPRTRLTNRLARPQPVWKCRRLCRCCHPVLAETGQGRLPLDNVGEA